MKYLIALLMSYLGIGIMIPFLKMAGEKFGLMNPKKDPLAYIEAIPLRGSLGIYLTLIIMVTVMLGINTETLGILLSLTLLFIAGTWYVWYKGKEKELHILFKLLIEIVASILVGYFGIRMYGINSPFSNDYILFPLWLQYMATVVWLMGITGIIEFVEQTAGLAPGITSISSLTLFIIALVMEQPTSALLALILCGISLGLLKYKRREKDDTIGGTEKLFLGFTLGIIALDGTFKSATVLSLIIPAVAIGLPALTHILVILKRMKQGKDEKLKHIETMDFRNRFNRQQTIVVLYLLSLCFSFTSIIILLVEKRP